MTASLWGGRLMERGCRRIVVIPGIMGSQLERDGEVLWWRPLRVFDHLAALALPLHGPVGAKVEATEVIEGIVVAPLHRSFYRSLFKLLAALGYSDREVLRFPYDWRLDCRESAQALLVFLHRERAARATGEEPTVAVPKLTILAHSMGGLVARYCVDVLGGDEFVDRIITLGTPYQGSLDAFETLCRGPRLFPGDRFRGRRLDAVRTFPSVYQLLCTDPSAIRVTHDGATSPVDIFEARGWLPRKYWHLICEARRFHDEFPAASKVEIFSVHGFAQRTLAGATVSVTGPHWCDRLEFSIRAEGDDRVLKRSAIFDSDRAHSSAQHHARIWKDRHVEQDLENLLCGRPSGGEGGRDAVEARTDGDRPGVAATGPGRPYVLLDHGYPFRIPGDSAAATTGLIDTVGRVVRDARMRLAVRDEDGEVIQVDEFTAAPASDPLPTLTTRVFRVPDREGAYAIQASVLEPDIGVDLVEDYFLTKAIEEPRP